MIKDIDSTALIICYQPEEEEEGEITESNNAKVAVKAKDTFFNYSEAIPNYLWQVHYFFPNRRLNGKMTFSKFRLTYNMDIRDIILILKEALDNFKFYLKI